MGVTEAKSKYEMAKKDVERCQHSIRELQRKCDDLQESLPGLSREIENAEKAKTAALDNFAMTSNKTTESALKAARQNCDDASKKLAETNELVEATNRALKKMESEFVTLQAQKDSLRHQVWNSLFEQRAAEIPESVRATVKELVAIGLQCSMGLNFILPKIFPLPTNSEIQEIYKDQTIKYDING